MVKEVEEIMVYFSGTKENKVPERDFMWAIL